MKNLSEKSIDSGFPESAFLTPRRVWQRGYGILFP